MTKLLAKLIIALLFVPSFALGKPLEVFMVGDAVKISALFPNKEGAPLYTFSPANKGKLVAPKITARKTTPIIPREKRTPSSKTNDIVKLGVIISESGKVIESVVASSTDSGFNTAAIAGVQGWEFSPALLEGKPVAFFIEIPLNFIVPKFTWH